MKSLNLKSFAAVLLVAAFSFASCKKDKDDVKAPANPGEGTWTGKYSFGNGNPTLFINFVNAADGTTKAVDEDNNVDGTGTWTSNGNSFKIVYSYNGNDTKLMFAGVINEAGTKVNGNWGVQGDNVAAGVFFLDKK